MDRADSAATREKNLLLEKRIEQLVDPRSFVEVGRFVVHQTADFGMAEKNVLGDVWYRRTSFSGRDLEAIVNIAFSRESWEDC